MSKCVLYCKRCKAELAWEHPCNPDHVMVSSDYEESEICRSCRNEIEESYIPKNSEEQKEQEEQE